MTLPLSSVLSRQFFRVTSMNFFFFASVNTFVLLPLYIQRLGGTEAQIGVVMGMYSAAGIFCQPVVGAWVHRVGRRALGAFVFGYVIHGWGYGVMWSGLTLLLAAGFTASFRLRAS